MTDPQSAQSSLTLADFQTRYGEGWARGAVNELLALSYVLGLELSDDPDANRQLFLALKLWIIDTLHQAQSTD